LGAIIPAKFNILDFSGVLLLVSKKVEGYETINEYSRDVRTVFGFLFAKSTF
jgi:hypothetical protein